MLCGGHVIAAAIVIPLVTRRLGGSAARRLGRARCDPRFLGRLGAAM
jgi:hypothetical protein